MRSLLALLALLSTVDAVGAVQTNVPDTVRFTPRGVIEPLRYGSLC